MRVGGAASRCGPTPGVITINLFVFTSLTYSQKFHDFMTFNTAISPNDISIPTMTMIMQNLLYQFKCTNNVIISWTTVDCTSPLSTSLYHLQTPWPCIILTWVLGWCTGLRATPTWSWPSRGQAWCSGMCCEVMRWYRHQCQCIVFQASQEPEGRNVWAGETACYGKVH